LLNAEKPPARNGCWITTERRRTGRRRARAPAHILWCSTDHEIGTTETETPPFPALLAVLIAIPAIACGMAGRLLTASWPVVAI
jgi:hypothetical protein